MSIISCAAHALRLGLLHARAAARIAAFVAAGVLAPYASVQAA